MARLFTRSGMLSVMKAECLTGSASRGPNDPRERRAAQAEQEVFSRYSAEEFYTDAFGKLRSRAGLPIGNASIAARRKNPNQ